MEHGTGAVTTRRGLIVAGAGAFAVAGGLGPAGAGAAGDPPPDDRALLTKVIAVELLGIAVQERMLAGGHLRPRAARATERILAQERVHVVLVGRELRALGGQPGVGPADAAAIDREFAVHHLTQTLGDIHDEKTALDLLLTVEGLSEGACYGAMSKLQSPSLQVLVARLLAAEAAHEAVLGGIRDPKNSDRAAPYAFVEGIR